MQLNKQKGFTLVEIAIVLVIVGLLIGGVLKGQEMITNAKLKRVESDNAGIAAAMFSYQDRYLQLPGDDDSASTRFTIFAGPPVVAGIDGDSDGSIAGGWIGDSAAAAPDQETGNFWRHLRAAGLIPGGGLDDTQPTNAYGGNIGLRDGSMDLAGHVTVFGSIEGPIAKIIEARLDDGDPTTGRVQSTSTVAEIDAFATSTDAAYVDDDRYFMAFRL
ncbi:MAG: type II secretion system protein [Rhodobacter sp.]|nr:type II secretion system protein [Gammaproteobacteria bacterium]MDJ0827999.1 type II secretion system protein [Rhodobacter sp.]